MSKEFNKKCEPPTRKAIDNIITGIRKNLQEIEEVVCKKSMVT